MKIEIKLQYEPGLGGAHSSGFQIQGLIAKQNEAQTVQNQIDEAQKSNYEKMIQNFFSDKDYESNLKHYIDQRQIYGPPPQPKTRIPQRPYTPLQDELNEYIKTKTLPKKTDFELVIDSLFSTHEKMEYLLSIGYVQDSVGKFYRADSTASSGELNRLFLHEITIKFKNLLLTKGTIKIKF
jgi:hypothetical protein